MAIKKFKLKENVSINELLEDGFSYSCDCKFLSKTILLNQSIIAWLKVSLKKYKLDIEVLDDDFCQYYTPFYEYQSGRSKTFDHLEKVIDRYNYEISKLNSIVEDD